MIRGQAHAGRTPSKPAGVTDHSLDPAEGAAWVDLALAMLNCNEFLYVP